MTEKEIFETNEKEIVKKTLNFEMESGAIWSLYISIPLTLIAPFISGKRNGGEGLLEHGFTYWEAVAFYSTILTFTYFLIFNRRKNRKDFNSSIQLDKVNKVVVVKKTESRHCMGEKLIVIISMDNERYLWLKDKRATFNLEFGHKAELVIDSNSKVVLCFKP